MFAYHGRHVIDLTGCDDGRNVILVTGRNGSGKTSLLNAIKLLFLGTNSEVLRRISYAQRDRMLSAKQFVRGLSNIWFGVLNRRALEQGGNSCRIALSWRQSGRTRTLSRAIRLTSEPFVEELRYEDDGQAFDDDEAQLQLQRLMPSEFVPFFFFDGEQIQDLADAEPGREAADIERLLNLAFVGTLVDNLRTLIKERRKAAYPAQTRVELTKHESDERNALAEREANERARKAAENEALELKDRVRRLEEARDRLRGGMSEPERLRLNKRIAAIQEEREETAASIAATLPPEAPFLINRDLVEAAFRRLDAETQAPTGEEALLDRMGRELPGLLAIELAKISPPVRVSEAQSVQLDTAVAAVVRSYASEGRSRDPVFRSMTPRQTKALRDRFLVWRDQAGARLSEHRILLQRMRLLNAEDRQVKRELLEAEVTSESMRQRFEELGREIASLHDEIVENAQARTRLEQLASRIAERIEAARNQVRKLQAEHESAVRDLKEVELATKVIKTLEELREARRRAKRFQVEQGVNDKVMLLLASSQLIKSVKLDDTFSMTFYDTNDQEVARTSISAGMRQLAATALLWALKEAAGRAMPMMIDTPLGRLDRENRLMLAMEYYPNAAKPLVLMPTNSEFTPDIMDILAPHIVRRYTIQNPDGVNAGIARDDNALGTING